IGGDRVGNFAAGTGPTLRAVSFEELILIDVDVSGRVGLPAAHGIRTRHGRIIGAYAREVNAGICARRGPDLKRRCASSVPNQNEVGSKRFTRLCARLQSPPKYILLV